MTLPIASDYAPMEARPVDVLPEGPEWQYEPKWDGFRCLAFKDGDNVDLRSKAGLPFNRYFPEVVAAMQALTVPACVLDGELVVQDDGTLSFDELLMRIHPAQSRVKKLAREHPATFVIFDLLVDAERASLVGRTLADRRAALEPFALHALRDQRAFRLSPMTRARSDVDEWFASFGTELDGVIAKRLDLPYQSGERTGMQKFKQLRTADCVVGGFRYGSNTTVVGSLLLGLFDDDGLLHHVGFTSNIPRKDRERVTEELRSRIKAPGFTGRAPGGPSRWSTERSSEWQPLEPTLVVEVRYDHFNAGRFRHGTNLLRWRPDKAPRQCTFEQLRRESAGSLLATLPAGR